MTREAFWARFDRSGGPASCWPWLGAHDRDGYGVVRISGVVTRTHVVAWETATGRPVPPGKVLRHGCDNPPCGNPAHLRVGTYTQNLVEAWQRRRSHRRRRRGRRA